MAVNERKDPYQGFRFKIEVEGLIVGGCSEISGLSAETQVEEYRQGGVNDHVLRLPRETKHANLVLKRGATDSEVFWKWHHDVVRGQFRRCTIHIVVLDDRGNDAWRFSFLEAYPVKWGQSELKADSNGVLFETLELAHSGFAKY